MGYALYNFKAILFLNIYLLAETFIYIFSKVFLTELHHHESVKRSIILLFLNFSEVVLSFALIYLAGNYLMTVRHLVYTNKISIFD